jgi:hypothetical protein
MSSLQLDQTVADKMVNNAIAYCTEKNFSGNTQETLHALRQGRCDICGYVCDNLGRQIGEYLGMMDMTVKAVYKYNPEYTAMHDCMGRPKKCCTGCTRVYPRIRYIYKPAQDRLREGHPSLLYPGCTNSG